MIRRMDHRHHNLTFEGASHVCYLGATRMVMPLLGVFFHQRYWSRAAYWAVVRGALGVSSSDGEDASLVAKR